jgi:ornithine--oxo-acid transaminase
MLTFVRPVRGATLRLSLRALSSSSSSSSSSSITPPLPRLKRPTKTEEFIALEERVGAHTYKPLNVVLSRGEGVFVYDVTGRRYFDFLSAYSAVNQGHSHPHILAAMQRQASKLTLTSRAFYNDQLGPFEEFVTTLFGYDRFLPMNTGVEACESSVKLARKWAYEVKGVPDGRARILFAEGNFWGRSIAAISSSSDPDSYGHFGPYVPNFFRIPYNDLDALERALDEAPAETAAFMVEPIQGEAGVLVPQEGYLRRAQELCRKRNVLLIADEVQTGIARTGRLLCSEHDRVKPDLTVLGKALSGGVMPVSGVLASNEVMLTLRPGQHGSTFGGNPLACAVATAALEVVINERLADNADRLGAIFRAGVQKHVVDKYPDIATVVRGRGLLNALIIKPSADGRYTALEFCEMLMHAGMLAKPTHGDIIRFAPPLVITEPQLNECISTIASVMGDFAKVHGGA